MLVAFDVAVFAVIVALCWQAYFKRRAWFVSLVFFWLEMGRDRGFWMQFLIFCPPVVVALLLCHWVNTHGWHATAAGGILFMMTLGLEAMRSAEEIQKWKKKQSDMELEQ